MKIRVIAIGKIKEQYLKEGIGEYIKRISPFCDISIVEVNDQPIADNPSEKDIEKAINIEGENVLKLIKNNDCVIALDLNKKEMDSIEFSNYLIKKLEISGSNLTFVIGGSYGLSAALKARANDSISLSKMTFLHQMTRLILLEQIYRAFKIYHHQTYHK